MTHIIHKIMDTEVTNIMGIITDMKTTNIMGIITDMVILIPMVSSRI